MRDVINHKDLGIKSDDILEEKKLERHSVGVYVLKIYAKRLKKATDN